MKKFLSVFILLILINLLIPVLYTRMYRRIDEFVPPSRDSIPNKDDSSGEIVSSSQPQDTQKNVVMMDKASDLMVTIPLKDYLIGAAACEMPAEYESEAIKAQMIAAYSYYLYCTSAAGSGADEYLTFNENTMTRYASKATLTQYWGTKFYDYYPKFERCADRVMGMVLTYGGEPALTVYHAVSCGNTRSSRERWDQQLPYLTLQDSEDDALSDDYLQIKEVDRSDMYRILKTNYPNLNIDEDSPEDWFKDIIYYESGYAQFVTVGIDKIPGEQFRKIFNLPSSCLMVFYEDNTFSLVTKGYGHGVGLSQFGANQMSQKGRTYEEILSHYYPGTKLEKIFKR